MNATQKPDGEGLKNRHSTARHRTDKGDEDTVQPGDLQGNVTLMIQTRQAQRLLKGRPKRGRQANIPGLYPFSARMRAIWMAARQDDPYAEWYLIQVGERTEQTRMTLSRLQQPLQERLQSRAFRALKSTLPIPCRPCACRCTSGHRTGTWEPT